MWHLFRPTIFWEVLIECRIVGVCGHICYNRETSEAHQCSPTKPGCCVCPAGHAGTEQHQKGQHRILQVRPQACCSPRTAVTTEDSAQMAWELRSWCSHLGCRFRGRNAGGLWCSWSLAPCRAKKSEERLLPFLKHTCPFLTWDHLTVTKIHFRESLFSSVL